MKSGFIKAKPVVIGQGGCNRAKWLNSREKVVVFGQMWRAKVVFVVFGSCVREKWLYWLFSCKSGCNPERGCI